MPNWLRHLLAVVLMVAVCSLGSMPGSASPAGHAPGMPCCDPQMSELGTELGTSHLMPSSASKAMAGLMACPAGLAALPGTLAVPARSLSLALPLAPEAMARWHGQTPPPPVRPPLA